MVRVVRKIKENCYKVFLITGVRISVRGGVESLESGERRIYEERICYAVFIYFTRFKSEK